MCEHIGESKKRKNMIYIEIVTSSNLTDFFSNSSPHGCALVKRDMGICTTQMCAVVHTSMHTKHAHTLLDNKGKENKQDRHRKGT